ncbi:hypothetical protein F7725_011546 [Dissostichus mawsoni]|uniref:Uncharacterized protein n=1 Tax=Dissostichus mawsoni TaxID=36200 RepID=A0A7J5Z9E1_DISMA|nr:hypothetical protein F7725_011546 [Dissostichus mawsoni]
MFLTNSQTESHAATADPQAPAGPFSGRQAESSKAERLAEDRQASERVNQQRMSRGAVRSRAPDLWIDIRLPPEESAARWVAVATAVEEEEGEEEEEEGAYRSCRLGIQILQSPLPPSLPH